MTGSKESLQFNKFEIYDKDGKRSVDMRSGTPRVEYRESVLNPYVMINVSIIETGNSIDSESGDGLVSVLDGLKLAGVNKVLFEIEDARGNKIKLTKDTDLRIADIQRVSQSFKNVSYDLVIVSKEIYDNTLLDNRVRKKFDGKISNCVKTILTRDLKTTKKIEVDETTNTYEKWGLDSLPFSKIVDLQLISIPNISNALGKTAGYLFWETSEGYNFKSLDKMFDTTGKKIKRYILNQKVDRFNVPPSYDDKILYAKTQRTIKALDQFESGAFGTQIHIYDPVNKTYTKKKPFVPPKDGNGVIAGKELPQFPEYADKATVRHVVQKDIGQTFNSGDSIETQVSKNQQEGVVMEEVVQQAMQNFRQKFNMSAEIIIPADFSLHAGDLVYCDFPEISTKNTLKETSKDSGIYMISDLCHYGDKAVTYTGLHLVRDSFGIKR